MTRDELLTALLVERFGQPVPAHHPQPGTHDPEVWIRLPELHDAISTDPTPGRATA